MSFPVVPKPSTPATKSLSGRLLFAFTLVPAALAAQQTVAAAHAGVSPLTAPQATASQAVSGAQGGTAAQNRGGSVRGTIADPDNAEIPGATVTLTPPTGRAITTTSGADGGYVLRGVAPGTYSLIVTMPGFATVVRQGVRVSAAAQPVMLDVKMAVQDEKTIVTVTADANTVSVDPDSNASSTVLTAKDLEAFSDDPDELSSELSALAGPASGPNGGQIYIDGFTGGQLPPKSSIREIRINQNPFSAQYDRPGFGRVEIFTKPGTDKFHGSAQLNGATKGFNTGSPYAQGAPEPGYHSIFGFGSVTGPINKSASFTMNGSYRNIQDNTIVDPPAVYAITGNPSAICPPGPNPACSIFNGYTAAQFVPQLRWDVSPRVDLALGGSNTMTIRFQYEHNSSMNQGIGGDSLFSTGNSSTSTESEIQISDTQIISPKVINETRFEYQRPTNDSTPYSTAPSINVQGAFSSGGNGGQTSSDRQTHIEAQNYTSIALAKHFIRLGGRLRTTGDTNTTMSLSNGGFTYNSIADYQNGRLSRFTIAQIPTPTISARFIDAGLYAEEDWKIRPNLTFSYGLRFETQNFIHDQADWAPRTSVAYGVGKKTVLRAGAGIFYDRFGLGTESNVIRNNGTNQQQYTISPPPAPDGTPQYISQICNPNNVAGCNGLVSGGGGRLTERVISPNLRSGYQIQGNVGVDQQLFRGATLSVNYQHIRGVHQFDSDVAPTPTTQPLLYQYQSEGVFNQNQLITNMNYRGAHGSLFGYYVLNFAKSDVAGAGGFASVPGNLGADYGRASFDVLNRLFLGGSFTLPYLVTASPFLVANSGSPYNIYSGTDLYGNNTYTTRAVFATPGQPVGAGGFVKTIQGCGTFATPPNTGSFTPVPINYCTGPASFTLNLRITKTIGFGPSTRQERPGGQGQGGGPGGSGGPPGGGRGPGGGGPGGGGGRGGGFGGGGGASSGRRYNLALGLQAQNLFNIVDRNVPIGTLSSPKFGQSTQLAGNIFTTDSAVRRISLQASFNF